MTQDQVEPQIHMNHDIPVTTSQDYLDDFQDVNNLHLSIKYSFKLDHEVLLSTSSWGYWQQSRRLQDQRPRSWPNRHPPRRLSVHRAHFRIKCRLKKRRQIKSTPLINSHSLITHKTQIPDVEDVHSARHCEHTLHQLEASIEDWNQTIDKLMEKGQSIGSPPMTTPLSELEFWVQRSAVFSSLSDQVHSDKIVAILDTVEAVSTDKKAIVHSLKSRRIELTKISLEAKENVKFLSTLERHFKTLATGSLTSMCETLPPMMNALRMVFLWLKHTAKSEMVLGVDLVSTL